MTTKDLSKQQALDIDPKPIKQTDFTGTVDQARNTAMSFIVEKAKKKYIRFLTRNRDSIVILFFFNTKLI